MKAEDVVNARFTPTKFREGYSQDEVDAFLERIRSALAADDATGAGVAGITVEDVVQSRFTPTKFRDGYSQDDVDDFLDQVVAELRTRAR